MQTPHRPRKWERGNIFFTFLHDHTADQTLLTVVNLAALYNIGDTTMTGVGGNLQEATRFLEIGGIVYSMCASPNWGTLSSPPTSGDFGIVDARMLLCSDRLDASTPPAPVALQTNWFTNTLPTTSVAEAQDSNAQYPTQIHHQEYWQLGFGSIPGQALEITAFPRVQTTETERRSRSQRLRLRLDDTEGLVLHLASRVRESAEVEVVQPGVWFTFVGTIYYRFVMGSR